MKDWKLRMEVQRYMSTYYNSNCEDTPSKIRAIKIVRENAGLSFTDAKKFVEDGLYKDE